MPKSMPKHMPPRGKPGASMSDAEAASKLPVFLRKKGKRPKSGGAVQSGGTGPGFSPAAY